MNYIGIRGHRGAGKSSVGCLLGLVMDAMLKDYPIEYIDDNWRDWCNNIMKDPLFVYNCSLDKVYLESFSDNIKVFVQMILGCPQEYLYNDRYKDTIVVNFRDFTYKEYDPNTHKDLFTADQMYDSINKEEDPQPFRKNSYMTLREFILYFGLEVMQRFFGRNVWVKSLKSNTELWGNIFNESNYYKIFLDLKTPAEATYIKQCDGVIINVTRPDNKKGSSGLERLGQDNRVDYELLVESDLYSIKEQVINIANSILYGRDEKENQKEGE